MDHDLGIWSCRALKFEGIRAFWRPRSSRRECRVKVSLSATADIGEARVAGRNRGFRPRCVVDAPPPKSQSWKASINQNVPVGAKKSHCNTTIIDEFAQICRQAWWAYAGPDCNFLNQCVLLQAKTGNWFALNCRGYCQKYRCGELPFSDAGQTLMD
jgi:hypothetical protein